MNLQEFAIHFQPFPEMKQAFPLIRFSQGNLVFIAGKPVIKSKFPCLFPALPCMGLKNFQKYKLKPFHYSTKVFLFLSLQIMLLLCIPASCSQLALKWRQIALAAGAKNCKIWQQVVTVPSGVTTHSSCTHQKVLCEPGNTNKQTQILLLQFF